MIVRCLHGFFMMDETYQGSVSDFISYSKLVDNVGDGFDVSPSDYGYTFTDLLAVPDYSIQGSTFMSNVATKTYEGKPWQLFKQNGLVYDFTTSKVVPITSITKMISFDNVGDAYMTSGLPLAGSITSLGKIKNYTAWFFRDQYRWIVSDVDYV